MKAFKVISLGRISYYSLRFCHFVFVSKNSMEQFVQPENETEEVEGKAGDTEGPLIEAEIEGEGALVLVLFVPVMGIPVDFNFSFLPVARESTDILETQLRDAEEEIERLKREVQKLKESRNEFIALRVANVNNLPLNQHSVVPWNTLVHNSSPRVFQVSANYQQVLILTDGFYQVSCRLTNPDSSGARCVSLKVNGTDVAQATNGFNTGYSGSVSVCDIIPLKANDTVSVAFFSDSQLIQTHISNQLSILKLA
jgi:hypothetical protein